MEEKKQSLTFIGFLKLLAKWKRSLIINLILVAAISVWVSLLLPKWYKATALVMPPQQENPSGISSLLSSLPISSLGINLGGNSENTLMAILKSRTLATDVIDKFHLKEFYDKKTMEETLLNFYSDYDVMMTEENMISISYEYTDSLKVAEIVNYIVNDLQKMAEKFVLQRAKMNYDLVRKRYFKNLRDIDSLQVKMEEFQKKYGVIEFYDQAKSIISAMVDLEAKALVKKVELQAIEKNYGVKSPQYRQALIQYQALESQIQKLKFSNKEKLAKPFSSLFLPLDELPYLTKEYTDLYTNLLLQQKLREYLLPEYEQAKIQLMKKQPTLQIIDYATPPDYKSKPKRAFIVLGALFIAFLIHLSIILFVEKLHWLKINEPEKFKDVQFIIKSFTSLKK